MHHVLGNLPAGSVRVILAVANDGLKIGDDAPRAFFDPLSGRRHPQAHRDQDGGLGLGLYICRQIALAHRGTIQARSDESQTVFEVRLPEASGDRPLIPLAR